MNSGPLAKWREALSSRAFTIQLSAAAISLAVLFITIGDFFAYVQSVQGTSLNDPVLDSIPADDMSVVIFSLYIVRWRPAWCISF